ncbi:MAG: T4 prohead core scaffold protein [Proteobacteria bacterium]|nr:T4 prohead core scaffold protein [Pseudomonadota bacterium]
MKEQIEEIEAQIEEDVNALLSGEDLSEEFKSKARTVFEAALNARTEQIEEAIATQYEERLAEEVEEIAEALTERVDAYLEYVADEWLQENALAIDKGIRNEFAESFLTQLRDLFEDHYVSVPEEKYDVLESMVEKLDEMETKLNEQIETNVALNRRLAEAVSDTIVSEVSEGLALSQKEKLASLAENVEFDGEDNFREKMVQIREAYFSNQAVTPRSTQDYLVEDVTDTIPYHTPSGSMEVYLNALGRVSKK